MRFKGKEQMQDALKRVFKISERKVSQADILRMATHLLNDLEIAFHFEDLDYKNEDLERFNQITNLNNGCFFARLINKHKESSRQKMVVQHYVELKIVHLIRAYRRIQKLLKFLILLRWLLLDDDVLLIERSKGKLIKPSHSLGNELQDLIRERHAIIKIIQQRQWVILNSRRVHLKLAIQSLKKGRTLALLAGMTNENQLKFLEGYFSLKEQDIIITPQLNEKMAWVTLQQAKSLGDSTGNCQINTRMSDEHCLAKLRDFENDERVKEPLEDHLAVVIEQSQLLNKDKHALAEIEDQLTNLLDSVDNKNDIILSDEEKALLENIDVTEFQEILTDLNIDAVVDAHKPNPPKALI